MACSGRYMGYEIGNGRTMLGPEMANILTRHIVPYSRAVSSLIITMLADLLIWHFLCQDRTCILVEKRHYIYIVSSPHRKCFPILELQVHFEYIAIGSWCYGHLESGNLSMCRNPQFPSQTPGAADSIRGQGDNKTFVRMLAMIHKVLSLTTKWTKNILQRRCLSSKVEIWVFTYVFSILKVVATSNSPKLVSSFFNPKPHRLTTPLNGDAFNYPNDQQHPRGGPLQAARNPCGASRPTLQHMLQLVQSSSD